MGSDVFCHILVLGRERREETSSSFARTFNCVTGLHVVTLKRWPEKYHNIVNTVMEEKFQQDILIDIRSNMES